MRVAAPLASAVLLALAPGRALVGRHGTLSDLTFLSARTGWVRISPDDRDVGTLYATEDGGRRWTVVRPGLRALAIAFGDRRRGAALVPVPGSWGMCHFEVTAVETLDGGRTWRHPATFRVEDGPLALAFAGPRPFALNASCAGAYATLVAPDARGDWQAIGGLAGPARLAAGAFSPGAIGLTPDGGIAAVAYRGSGPTGHPLIQVFARKPGRDLGPRAWRASVLDARGLPGRIQAVSFVDAQDGIVAAQSGERAPLGLWTTHDAGHHWHLGLSLPRSRSVALDMVTRKVGYAGATALFKTTDGGRTWHALRLPASPAK